MKTRDKILLTSLALFNEKGERTVTTNHIAAELGISPGNLYYHFANKDEIIYELFLQYRARTSQYLMAPEDRPLTYADKLGYFEAIFINMWEFRFFHRDLEQMLANNEKLKVSYREFAVEVLAQAKQLFKQLTQAGLVEASDEDIEALVVNIWVIATSWATFLHSTGIYEDAKGLDQTMLKRGIYQIICLEAPYTAGEARANIDEMKRLYSS